MINGRMECMHGKDHHRRNNEIVWTVTRNKNASQRNAATTTTTATMMINYLDAFVVNILINYGNYSRLYECIEHDDVSVSACALIASKCIEAYSEKRQYTYDDTAKYLLISYYIYDFSLLY